jgi:hypothetical protein
MRTALMRDENPAGRGAQAADDAHAITEATCAVGEVAGRSAK